MPIFVYECNQENTNRSKWHLAKQLQTSLHIVYSILGYANKDGYF